ncbi:MAG: DUF3347 domain-containing protein [Treponema sp.]|jgi:hypothetical protein|nr:DUF3347 domain-containing protein [Treponema sp.]
MRKNELIYYDTMGAWKRRDKTACLSRLLRAVKAAFLRCHAVFLFLLLFCPASSLYAKAGVETAPAPLNPQWGFAVTAFDISALPPEHQGIGELVQREFVLMLNSIKKRRRGAEEYAYYEVAAWEKNKATAAKAIADKWNQRDNLLFLGDPAWKYKKHLKTINSDIEKLREAFEKASEEAPLITQEPVFILIEDNRKGTYPKPPETGKEYAFCVQQKVDGFLTGAVALFQGRIYLTLKVYTLYSNSYSYKDSILFSSDHMSNAVKELSGDLTATLSGVAPATLTLHTDAPDAVFFLNETFAGTGEISGFEYPHGEVTVTASASKRETASVSFELNEGEQTDVSFTLPLITFVPVSLTALTPQAKSRWAAFAPTVFAEQGAAVYQGALYVGRTPLTLDGVSGAFTYYRVESDQTGLDGTVKKTAGTVVIDSRTDMATIKTRVLPDPEKKPVEKAMDRMYLSYGLFWLTLPIALTAGMDALWGGNGGMLGAAIQGRSLQDATTWLPISIGAAIAAGTALGFTIFNAVVYFSTANKNSPVVVK